MTSQDQYLFKGGRPIISGVSPCASASLLAGQSRRNACGPRAARKNVYCTGEISHRFQKHGSGFFRSTLKVSVNPLIGGMWNYQTDKTGSRTGITRDWEEGGMESYCLKEMGFQSGKMKKL